MKTRNYAKCNLFVDNYVKRNYSKDIAITLNVIKVMGGIKLIEEIAKSIAEGYTVGILLVESDRIFIEGEKGMSELYSFDTIEVYNGSKIERITHDQALYTFTEEGWPAYGGLTARYMPIKLTVLTEEDYR
jgi:hypothetical protein